jgi:hypothetical protein
VCGDMVRRMISLLVAGWWVAWVLVIVPAHTRGVISLSGACAACEGGGGKGVPFFFGTVKACCAGKAEGKKDAGKKGSSGDCAICQIVATTSHVGWAKPVLSYLELLGVLRAVAPNGAVHYAVLGLPMGTGPPVV